MARVTSLLSHPAEAQGEETPPAASRGWELARCPNRAGTVGAYFGGSTWGARSCPGGAAKLPRATRGVLTGGPCNPTASYSEIKESSPSIKVLVGLVWFGFPCKIKDKIAVGAAGAWSAQSGASP